MILRSLIVLPDGTELFSGIGEYNNIRNTSLTKCVNDETELTLGSVCSSMLKCTLQTPDGGLSIAAGTEVTLYKVDEAGTRHKVGLFRLEKPERPTAHTYKLTAYDRASLLDKDLTTWMAAMDGWPYKVSVFAGMVCEACGLTLAATEWINGDYEIQKFIADGVTGRILMKWIGEIEAKFVRANADGEIELGWYEKTGITITPNGDPYFYSGKLSYEDYEVAAIQRVQVRLTEDDVGVVYPETEEDVNTYSITGNYLLTATTAATLEPVVRNIYGAVKDFLYTPCEVKIPLNLDIDAGDVIDIADANGKTITSCVMTLKQTGQSMALESTGSHRRDSSTVVNNVTLGMLRAKMLEVQRSIEGLRIKASSIMTSMENLETKVEGIDGIYFHVRYSANADGSAMTAAPADDTKYMGTCSTNSETAPTAYTDYTWVKIGGEDGKDGAPGTNGTNGKTQYLHIKYSDNGETFTPPENLLPVDINSWRSGWYQTAENTNVKRIYCPEMIQVTPGESYEYSLGNADYKIGITSYSDADDSTYITANQETTPGTYTAPSGTNYIRVYIVPNDPTAEVSFETYQGLFASGEMTPTMYRKNDAWGELLGAWIGTLVDFNPSDSENFDDYTWKKFTEDVDEEIQTLTAELNILSDRIESEVKAQTQRGDDLEERLVAIEQTSEDLNILIQKMETDGANKVVTSMGYTFDDSGLHIQRGGSEIENTIDETGMYVTRSGETMLQANADGVEATDLKARNYLIIGDYCRVENYSNGSDSKRTGIFWIGGST